MRMMVKYRSYHASLECKDQDRELPRGMRMHVVLQKCSVYTDHQKSRSRQTISLLSLKSRDDLASSATRDACSKPKACHHPRPYDTAG